MTADQGEQATYEQRLAAFVGTVLSARKPGPDAVNLPMIRHWVDTMELANPAHLDDEAARATGRPGIVAPAAMMQAWVMPTYADKMRPHREAAAADPQTELTELLAEGGYTSVVATDSDFEFIRELVPGDRVSVEEVVEDISPEKTTGLGVGRFVTTLKTYRDADGEVVATQRWRLLRFRPAAATAPRTPRPRPAVNPDNAFWFEAAKEHRLLIQRCVSCGTLRHPPGPGCGACGGFEWDTVTAGGRGTVYSYTVAHHPRHPAFDYPLVIAVVELAEGTRLITNLVDVTEPVIGMPVELRWLEADPELTLPVFGPAQTQE